MAPEVRRAFLWVAAITVVVAVGWASMFDSISPAQFSMRGESDPKTLDPARATGNVEGRVIYELFEGLLRMMPAGKPDPVTGLQPLTPHPGMAASYELSDDKRQYTFHLRDNIRWTDGTPVTSHDFAWSWQRFLHPATASEYTFHLYGIPNAQAYNQMTVEIGDKVEVELWDRPGETPTSEANYKQYPRGTVLYGILTDILKPPEPSLEAKAKDQDAESKWKENWVYSIDVAEVATDGSVDWNGKTTPMQFACSLTPSTLGEKTGVSGTIQRAHYVLVAFEKLGGVQTPDEKTLIVTLTNPIPYFPNIVAFYPLFPVNRKCVETHGSPMWTTQENIVTNGPYKLQMRRLRDRLRLVKNDDYYAAEDVSIKTVDVLSLEGANSSLNMYETGQLDWIMQPPDTLMDELKKRDDFHSAAYLSVYFYRLNVKRPPLDNVLVRRAMAMAIDRVEIVEEVAKAGQIPAHTIVPPGLAGYESAKGITPDVAEARRLLAEAGFPGGRGFPKLTILYNTLELHRSIAEVVQQQLQNNLNISIELQNMEWGSFLDKVQQTDYQIARSGWIADYPDPNTFLDMWVSGGPQNNTNWANAEFDQLIAAAAKESDPAKRLTILRDAEQIWVDEMPAIPVYYYTSNNLVKPHVKGFILTAQDLHPLQLLSLEEPHPSISGQH